MRAKSPAAAPTKNFRKASGPTAKATGHHKLQEGPGPRSFWNALAKAHSDAPSPKTVVGARLSRVSLKRFPLHPPLNLFPRQPFCPFPSPPRNKDYATASQLPCLTDKPCCQPFKASACSAAGRHTGRPRRRLPVRAQLLHGRCFQVSQPPQQVNAPLFAGACLTTPLPPPAAQPAAAAGRRAAPRPRPAHPIPESAREARASRAPRAQHGAPRPGLPAVAARHAGSRSDQPAPPQHAAPGRRRPSSCARRCSQHRLRHRRRRCRRQRCVHGLRRRSAGCPRQRLLRRFAAHRTAAAAAQCAARARRRKSPAAAAATAWCRIARAAHFRAARSG
eukprot:345289-Chlamydomonas_euryale.AAC.7